MTTCETCHDTGSTSREISGHLDCTKCGVAEERRELNAFVLNSMNGFFMEDRAFQVHQRARKIERESGAPAASGVAAELTDEQIDDVLSNLEVLATTKGQSWTQAKIMLLRILSPRAVLAKAAPVAAGDMLFRSRTADLLHLIQYYPHIAQGDDSEALKAIADLKRMLASAPAAPIAAVPESQIDALCARIKEMQGHTYTCGAQSYEAVRVALDGVLDEIAEITAAPAAPVAAASEGWISVTTRLPAVSELVMVYSPSTKHDHPGAVNISFDCIDPNDDDHASWLGHNEHYEYFCCVGKLEGSIGPREKAPYTHWQPLPSAPVSSQNGG